jgi:carboxymethylenebutenolidase
MTLVRIPSPGVPLAFGQRGHPMVILVHDWYGRLPWLEEYGRALARQGFHVLVPDLYDGWATTEESEAEHLLDKLDLVLSVNSLGTLARGGRAAGAPGVALVGFSMGGWLALVQAKAGSVEAVVAYYATMGESEHSVVPCPVQLHFAEIDEWEEGGDPDSFVARLQEDGTTVERHDYVGTVHSFANATIPEKADRNAAALSFARTATFLEKHLSDWSRT